MDHPFAERVVTPRGKSFSPRVAKNAAVRDRAPWISEWMHGGTVAVSGRSTVGQYSDLSRKPTRVDHQVLR